MTETARRIADQAESLAAGVTSYRQVLESLDVAVYTTDADGRITFYNDAAAELWGRRPEPGEEWCGSWRLYWPDGRPMAHAECPMAIALREGRLVRGSEAVAERPDGTRVPFVPYPTPMFDDDGRLIGAVNVLVDVSGRHRAEEALRTAVEALRRSNAVKDEFLGLVSHELRTPVTTILGNARLLLDRETTLAPTDRRSMLNDIATDAHRLHRIVENLLLLTRLESGLQIELEPQVLDRVVTDSVATFRHRRPDRLIRIEASSQRVIVEADRTYLDLLLENLLSNADKYSPGDRPVTVVIDADDREARISVLDEGIGFSAEEAFELFEPFYRTEAARAHGSGVGVGLTACKRLVEVQGGRIWARPRPEGGAEVGFALAVLAEATADA
jgi:PAS domain S-box-containing protein